MTNEITPELLIRIRRTIRRCLHPAVSRELRGACTDPRLEPWRELIEDEIGGGRSRDIDIVIDMLINRYSRGYKINALVMLVRVLRDRQHSEDVCRDELLLLENQLAEILESSKQIGKTVWQSKRIWRSYLNRLISFTDEIQSSGFDETAGSVNLPYIDLLHQDGQFLSETLEQYLGQEDTRMMVLVGESGTGKTTFLKATAREYAERALSALNALEEKEFFQAPSGWVPVYCSLNRYEDRGELTRYVVSNGFLHFRSGFTEDEAAYFSEQLLRDQEITFLLLLDALDEIAFGDDNWRSTTNAIEEIITALPHCKFLLTTRPETIPDDWSRRYPVSEIMPLADEQLDQTLARYLDYPEQLFSFARNSPEVAELMRIPLTLEPIVSYWLDLQERQKDKVPRMAKGSQEDDAEKVDDAPVLTVTTGDFEPNQGELADEVFQTLLAHDREKGSLPRYSPALQEREIALRRFAAYLDGKREAAPYRVASRYLQGDILPWALRMGILRRPQPDQFDFKLRLAKLYFAGRHIVELIESGEEEDEEKLRSLPQSFFWEECLELVMALTLRSDVADKVHKYLIPRELESGG